MRIRVSAVTVFFLFLLLATDREHLALASILAAAFHECGHLAAAALLRVPLRSLRLDLMGAGLEPAETLFSYSSEFLLAAAGPLFSFLLPVLLLLTGGSATGFWFLLSSVSLLLGTLNLLPIPGFDGGRMLSSALNARLPFSAARRISEGLGLAVLFLLWALGAYLLLRGGAGLSLFCFSASLFSRLSDPRGRL